MTKQLISQFNQKKYFMQKIDWLKFACTNITFIIHIKQISHTVLYKDHDQNMPIQKLQREGILWKDT